MKKVYIILLVICLILIGLLVVYQIVRYNKLENSDGSPMEGLETLKVYVTDEVSRDPAIESSSGTEVQPADTETVTEAETESEPEKEPEPTLDFNVLWDVNPEVCAWIEIAGTVVDYPVLQSPKGNDNKYLTTRLDGKYYIGGSLFIQETYNSRDFNDRVTVIYGHTMPDESIFGQIERIYSNPETFKACKDIKVYLPDGVRHYEVFAAVPFEKIHLLATYDFDNDYWYNSFFKRVKNVRDISACFDEGSFPTTGDRVLILSTCLNKDPSYRYLVMAVDRDDLMTK